MWLQQVKVACDVLRNCKICKLNNFNENSLFEVFQKLFDVNGKYFSRSEKYRASLNGIYLAFKDKLRNHFSFY